MKLSKTVNRTFSLSMALVISIICILTFFLISESMKVIYLRALTDMTSVAKTNIEDYIATSIEEANFIANLQSFSNYMVNLLDGTQDSIEAKASYAQAYNYICKKAEGTEGIERIDVVNMNKRIILSSNTENIDVDVASDENYDLIMNSEKWGANILTDTMGKHLIVISKPLIIFDKPQGYIFIKLNFQNIQQAIDSYVFGKTGNLFFITPQYDFIGNDAATLPGDIYSLKECGDIISLLNGESHLNGTKHCEFLTKKEDRYMIYSAISNLNIIIATSIDKNEVYQASRSISFPVLFLFLVIVSLFFYYRFIISKKILHPLSLLSRSLYMIKKGDLRARYNYNVDNEFGHLSKIFNQTVSNLQNMTESLKEREIKNCIILDTITDVIWEYNIKDKTILLSENWMKLVNFDSIIIRDNYSIDSFMYFFHFSFVEKIKNAITSCIECAQPINMECQLKVNEKEYSWIKINGSCMYNAYNEPYKIIGSFFDITDMKKREVILLDSAVRDDMTKLLKKREFERLVNNDLELNQFPHAILMMDLDSFKTINDTYGHLVGDEIIVYTANVLRMFCDKDCYIARFGGDEFTIYTRESYNVEESQKLASDIIMELNKGYTTFDNKFVKLGCSIGIAQYPIHGNQYYSLLESADRAIYKAKSMTKNCYVVYDDDFV